MTPNCAGFALKGGGGTAAATYSGMRVPVLELRIEVTIATPTPPAKERAERTILVAVPMSAGGT